MHLSQAAIAAQTQRPVLKYGTSDAGIQTYIEAAKAAFQKNYAPLETIIRGARRSVC